MDEVKNTEEMKNDFKAKDFVLYIIALMLFPVSSLFTQYNHNRVLVLISFEHVLVFGIAFAVVSAVLYLIVFRVLRNMHGAFLVTVLFWIVFWFFEPTYSVIVRLFTSLPRLMWFSFLIICLICVAICAYKHRPKLDKIRPAFLALAAFLCVNFLIAFVPALHHEVTIRSAVRDRTNDYDFYLKQDFRVNSRLPSPDIYWLYVDGMMTMNVIERYLGYSQDYLRNALYERDFMVYEEAYLLAGSSHTALTSLFSPAFYDSYFGAVLAGIDSNYLLLERSAATNAQLAQDGFYMGDDVMANHEMFRAFRAAGYEAITFEFSDYTFTRMSFNRAYNMYDEAYPLTFVNELVDVRFMSRFLAESGRLIQLLAATTPLSIFIDSDVSPVITAIDEEWFSIPAYTEELEYILSSLNNANMDPLARLFERQKYRMLLDSFTIPSPRVVFMLFNYMHPHWWHMHDEYITWRDTPSLDMFYAAQSYTVSAVIKAIDMILDNNPNAVIIIQADHGIHDMSVKQELLDSGFTIDEVIEMYLSTMSAVRIPPEYGGLDAPLAPLNISRELVNRFVGENYILLSSP